MLVRSSDGFHKALLVFILYDIKAYQPCVLRARSTGHTYPPAVGSGTMSTDIGTFNLTFVNNSIRNNTITCDSLGIHFELSRDRDSGVISVRRWDSAADVMNLVGQVKFHLWVRNEVRMGGEEAQWSVSKEFLRREGGAIWSTSVRTPLDANI